MDVRKIISLIIFATLIWDFCKDATAAPARKCGPGTYLFHSRQQDFCRECPDGTFMPWENHEAKKCFECTQIDDPKVETLVKPCDKLHDADIQCVDGYYRYMARNSQDKATCKKCTPACPEYFSQIYPCQNFTDLECCPQEKVDNSDKKAIRCGEKPRMCSRGQYLDTDGNLCKPCPQDTYMPEDQHSNNQCLDCQYIPEADLPLHVAIIQPCTNTQPPRYGCEDGFYSNQAMSYSENDISCSPCHRCQAGKFVGRQCDKSHDTVCCEKPNMPVLDDPNGGFCITSTGELLLHPFVEELRVRKGNNRSLFCYVALGKGKQKPKLTWDKDDSSVTDKNEQFQYEKENNQTGVTVYYNILTIRQFSAADDGMYRCKDSTGILRVEPTLFIRLACDYGTYNPPACDKTCNQHCKVGGTSEDSLCDDNSGACLFGCLEYYTGNMCETRLACKDGSYNPPACDKTCSQHCRVSETSDVSLCDNNNGTCLFGCQKGYTGDRCETVQEKSRNQEDGNDTYVGSASAIIVLAVILVLVLIMFTTCVVYNKRCQGSGPLWWQRLVRHILTQPKIKYDDYVELQPFMEEKKHGEDRYQVNAETETTGTQLRRRKVKPETKKMPRKLKQADYTKIWMNYNWLLEELDAHFLINELFLKGVLNIDDKKEIDEERIRKKRTDILLQMILDSGPGYSFEIFVEILKVNYPHVADKLTKQDRPELDYSTSVPADETEADSGIPASGTSARSDVSAVSSSLILKCKNNCPKKPTHEYFIPFPTFKECRPDDIPPEIYKYLVNLGKQTVKVFTTYISPDRPDGYPMYEIRGSNGKATGSGRIYRVLRKFSEKDGKTCPCLDCLRSSRPKKQWGEFMVITTKKVVYNDEECAQSYCLFGYDSPDMRGTCPELRGVRIINEDISTDVCEFASITHDSEVSLEIEEICRKNSELSSKISDKCYSKPDEPAPNLAVVISHPHGLSKHVTIGYCVEHEPTEVGQTPSAVTYTADACSGSHGGPVFLLNSRMACCTSHRETTQIGLNFGSGVLWSL